MREALGLEFEGKRLAIEADIAPGVGLAEPGLGQCIPGTQHRHFRLRAQFEGAAAFGASLTLVSELTTKAGRVEQSNFDGYEVVRMGDAPLSTRVHIVQSDAPPAGVGEPGVPPMAPAICNAIFAATGKRLRDLPIRRVV